MSLKSRMSDSYGKFSASTFYAVVGITCFVVLVTVDLRLIHIGIIGLLSLMTSYGLLKKKLWSKWIVVALFFIGTTFSGYTLYRAFQENLIYDLILGFYLISTWIFTGYIVMEK